jgi:hypothetical protein
MATLHSINLQASSVVGKRKTQQQSKAEGQQQAEMSGARK